MVQNGQELEVIVLNFEEETERVSLGYKQLIPDPFEDVGSRYPIGAIVRGTVVHTTDHHAFIKLEEGIEGIVHVSEMSWNPRIKSASKFVEKESVIEAKVQAINYDERRLSLSMRELEDDPWEDIAHRYPVNSIVKGVVRNITDFGIFIGLDGNIDGLVHLSDISWDETGEEAVREYKKGDEIETVILSIDSERERISLGVKQLGEDPFASFTSEYERGSVVKGIITAVDAKGATVAIADGIEGYLRGTELGREKVEDVRSVLKEGDEIEAKIVNVDRKTRNLSLSVKAIEMDDERAAIKDHKNQDVAEVSPGTIGDLIKAQMEKN